MAVPPGRLIYTQLCNQRGGIEADLTVCRLSENEFYIVTGTGSAARDFNWIERNLPAGWDVRLADVSQEHAVLGLMGPMAREILSQATDADLSNDTFPFATSKEIQIAGATVRAMRVTFVGELGWELHMPVESAGAVYDRLMELGQEHGIANAGYRAIDTAFIYAGEKTEKQVGLALAASKLSRDDVFLTTKHWRKYHGYEPAKKCLALSLSRLGVTHVDLWLMHWPGPAWSTMNRRKDLIEAHGLWHYAAEGMDEGAMPALRAETWRAMELVAKLGWAKSIRVSACLHGFGPQHRTRPASCRSCSAYTAQLAGRRCIPSSPRTP